MALIENMKFAFVSDAEAPDTFTVLRFKGVEAISRPYRFEIELIAEKADVDLKAVIKKACRLSLPRPDGDVRFHGVLVSFDLMHQVRGHALYRAVMVPRLERLKYTRHNQVFLGRTALEIVQAVLKDGGLTATDFECRTSAPYGPWDYACQYGETHFAFVSRWMERVGMYYFFEQGDSAEIMVLADMAAAHGRMPQLRNLTFSPPSGLTGEVRENVVHALICRQNALPQKVQLKDYNYLKPSTEIEGEAEVSPDGTGTVYIYGEHFMNETQGKDLARIRAEEIRCRERVFHGESLCPYLRPGYVFDLDGHFRPEVNTAYLTVNLEHHGDQTAFLPDGVRQALNGLPEGEPFYRNSFTLIPADVQFRPERVTEKPRFHSTLNAKIDAEGSGTYAELDDHGRYKVRLPFDMGDQPGGKASSWLRMAQPYAGQDYGQHFPLHKGTEVLLSFIDGDPDRPIISAAVPNWDTPSPVVDANETLNVIKTAAGNRLELQDQKDEERVRLATPKESSFLQLGALGEETDNIVLSSKGSGLIRTGRYLKTETGAARTQGAPYDGDSYLSVERDHVQDIGKDFKQTVHERCVCAIGAEGLNGASLDVKVTGDHKELVTGAQSLGVDGLQTYKVGGDRTGEIAGTDNLTVNGDQNITIKGAQTVTIEGECKSIHADASAEIYASAKAELYSAISTAAYMAGKLELYASLAASFFIAGSLEISASDSWKFGLAKSVEAKIGASLAVSYGVTAEATYGACLTLHEAVEVYKTEAKVEDATLKAKNSNLTVDNSSMHIKP